eukprot:s284_g13.t1
MPSKWYFNSKDPTFQNLTYPLEVSNIQSSLSPGSCQNHMVHSSSVLRVRLEPGIPKLLVKINPTDAESFHAKNLGEVILRKGVTSRSQVAVLHMSRGTAAGEVLMSVKLADLLDLEDGQGVEVAAAAVPTAPTSLNSAASRGRVPPVAAVNAPRQECTWERTHNHGLSPEFGQLNGFGGSGRGVDPGGSFDKRHSPEKGTASMIMGEKTLYVPCTLHAASASEIACRSLVFQVGAS